MDYVPYEEIGTRKNLIVDGSPHPHSGLVLSHWKGSGTSPSLMRDTSAEIVLDYLKQQTFPSDVTCVSNDHFDEDGLIGIFSVLNPTFALMHRDLLVDVAEAGDFAKFKDRKAARIAFAISSMVQKNGGFIPVEVFNQPYPQLAAELYRRMLSVLPDLVKDINKFEKFWADEDQFLSQSEDLFKDQIIQIEEIHDLDLAIVHLPNHVESRGFHRFTQKRTEPIHEMSVHNRTRKLRVLYRQGQNFWFKFRYETWVQLREPHNMLRVNLGPLADLLNTIEGESIWTYSSSNKISPVLKAKKESSVPFAVFFEHLTNELREGFEDWNPYR